MRIELVDSRDTLALKEIITKHVLKGNIIVTDSWNGYNFLNSNDSLYTYIVHNHSRGAFGSGLESTSRIESIWGQLKEKIKKLYHSIPSHNFLFFLREAEYRLIISKYNKIEKMDNFSTVLSIVGNRLGKPYLSYDQPKSFDHETYFDEENEEED